MSFHSWLGFCAPGTRQASPTMAAGSSAALGRGFEESKRLAGEGERDSEGADDDDDDDDVVDWVLYAVEDMMLYDVDTTGNGTGIVYVKLCVTTTLKSMLLLLLELDGKMSHFLK